MFIPVIAIIGAVAMGLSVVSTAINMKTIIEMETDRYYVAETEQMLEEQYSAAEEKLEMARFQNDPMAVAEYETLLKNIQLLRDRSNVVAIGRQVEQKKATFIKEQWDVFVADMSIRAVSWGIGKVGFGKVTDTYMRGKNWPPGSNFAVWNPLAGQTERIILGSKPELVAVQFSDELADFMSAILTGFDVARTVSAPEDIRQAANANTFVTDELAKMDSMRPLPKDIGDYLASSMVKKIIKQNPQLAGESDLTKAIFGREQSCNALQKLWLEEQRDVVRSEAIVAAMNRLECEKLVKPIAEVTEEILPTEESYETAEPAIVPEETEPASVAILPVPTEETSEEIPAGTYIGTIKFSEKYDVFAISKSSEVIITIGDDGKVSGSFYGLVNDMPYSYENCEVAWETNFSGEFNGRLTRKVGVIQSSETMDTDPNTNCPSEFKRDITSFNRNVSISISGNSLTGVTDLIPGVENDAYILTFVATKQ